MPHAKGKKVGLLKRGRPRLLIVGEAPGPRGASVTGYPFWGDVSGKQLYALLGELELLKEKRFAPDAKDKLGSVPPEGNYAITNAVDRMPWDSRLEKFRAPKLDEIKLQSKRMRQEIHDSGTEVILAVGLPAAKSLDLALETDLAPQDHGMRQIVERALDRQGKFKNSGPRVFATFHPSYGQWKRPGLMELHTLVVKALKRYC